MAARRKRTTPETGSRILVVDDEVAIRRVLRVTLTSVGYLVHEALSGRDALNAVSKIHPDLIILDLGLPDMDGANVVCRVRESSHCPILILSVRGQESDKAAVLNSGADDYLTKPFGTQELLARVRAILRRSSGSEIVEPLACGRVTIHPGRRSVNVGDQDIHLTRTEYLLLRALVERQGNVATHRQLIREVWGGIYSESALHLLHVSVSHLRRKIEPDALEPECLLTVPGVGYRMATKPRPRDHPRR